MSDHNDTPPPELPEQLYRDAAEDMPPPELDRRVLAMAQRHSATAADTLANGAAQKRWWLSWRWQSALAGAAVLLFSVSVVRQYSDSELEQTIVLHERTAPAEPAAAPAPSPLRARDTAGAAFADLSEAPTSGEPPAVSPVVVTEASRADVRLVSEKIVAAQEAESAAAQSADAQGLSGSGTEQASDLPAAATPQRLRAETRQEAALASIDPGAQAFADVSWLGCDQVTEGLCLLAGALQARHPDCRKPAQIPPEATMVRMDGVELRYWLQGERVMKWCVDGSWQAEE